jgi:hypothetical protein
MTDILVEPDYNEDAANQTSPREDLVEWCMGYLDDWRVARDSTFRDTWDEYYKVWRGRWTPSSVSRRTERSRIISPASQIAVDLAVAEIIEALFSRQVIFDVSDDIDDENREDAIRVRDLMIEDLKQDGLIEAMQEVVLNGALYGEFIAKIVTDISEESFPEIVEKTGKDGVVTREVKKNSREVIKVYPVAVEPGQLIVDPNGTELDLMLGAAHEFPMPLHAIQARQASGVYFDDAKVGSTTDALSTDDRADDDNSRDRSPSATVQEYHGLVPLKLLSAVRAEGDDLAEAIVDGDDGDEMVEAIVTIANGSVLLRAIPNPSVMEDRAIIAEQYDTVPNRFWGRGIMEKGFNMQKALDSEMRARADSLAWVNNPMLAGDITKMPPGGNLNVWPGKFWGFKGDPREAITELRFGDVNASTFQQTGELERMHQQATGAIDPSILNAGTRDQATGASAINVSGIVKRSKRTMLNLEVFMSRLIRRIAWRKMQANPERYPQDYKFVVRGTVGIMAREVEQQQLVQVLQFVDKGTPAYFAVLKRIFEGSTMSDKSVIMGALDLAMQPPSEEAQAKQQQMEQMQQQMIVEQVRNTQADTALKLSGSGLKDADKILKTIEADLLDDQLMLQSVKSKVDIQQAVNQERQITTGERKQALEEEKFRRGD